MAYRESFIEKAESLSINKNALSELRNRYNLNKFVIGYIGTISKYEGLDLLIDVFSDYNAKDASLLIIGDGPHFKQIKQKVEQIGNNNIVLSGRIPFEEIFHFYKLIDFFVLPRNSTPVTESVTPIKPFEIMYAKKPLLCSSVGGFTEIIKDGQNGLIFQADNKEDLTVRLKKAIDNRESTNLIVNRAYEDVCNNYRWENIGKKYMQLIVDVFQQFNSKNSNVFEKQMYQ